ncbi:MAG: hypothetical protein QM654_03490 [Dysgonamonadaceae bacterium]
MKRNIYLKVVMLCFAVTNTVSLKMSAQEKNRSIVADTTKATVPKAGATSNVMLNASADNGPRVVNIGLPASVGGTTILENGLPVVYDFMGQMPTSVWRQDGGISKFEVLDVSKTALLASDVGVSVSTWTNRGSKTLKGSAGFNTNSFGLLRGDVAISGPINQGLRYSLTAFINMDPGTFHSNISTFLDKTSIFKGVLNKQYKSGQIGIQYKYAYSSSVSMKQSPYIYREDGSVDKLPNFRIGRDAYIEQSGLVHGVDPLSGEEMVWDALKDISSQSHVIDIFGDHKFPNNMVLDYTLRYHNAKSGLYNPYYSDISGNSQRDPNSGLYPYYYSNFSDAYGSDNLSAYTGKYIQEAMMIFSPRTQKNTIMARLELSKKSGKHHWMLGLHNWYYKVDKAKTATYVYMFETAPNPKGLVSAHTDKYGNMGYNSALQYYNGMDNKMALVGTDKWIASDKIEVNGGTRLEWQRIDGDWCPKDNRKKIASGAAIVGETVDIKKDWFNVSVTANLLYKVFNNAGFIGDGYYIQQAGKLSAYSGADDPKIETCKIPGFSIGVYYNNRYISLVSKMTRIKRTNFKNNSTFNAKWTDDAHPGVLFSAKTKQTSSYDVSTIGWTTDLLLTPFRNFKLHLLFTVQNPEYQNYAMTIKYEAKDPVTGATISTHEEHVNNNGNVARSVSKTLLEIDPSYTFGKFRMWASARYFSKEYANYPNTLIFKGRWETFAGVDFKYDKNVSFSLNVVNMLNQKGAQGSISGTNTTTAEMAKKLYDKPLSGTYIRPFTVELKTKVKF